MAKQVAVLAHNQPVSARAATFYKREVAMMLVARLMAEQITQSCIRMFPPSSAFQSLKPSQVCSDGSVRSVPDRMPRTEVGLCHFHPPQSDQWKLEHMPARRLLIETARLAYREMREAHL